MVPSRAPVFGSLGPLVISGELTITAHADSAVIRSDAMKVTIFAGDIANAPAEAICTSTNPGLTLVMGTGAAVRDRGGFEILRACEKLVADGPLAAGSVHVTTAGRLPAKAILHCVASDASHHSSPEIVKSCVRQALLRAAELQCRSVAMPVFAAGHARLRFDAAVRAIAEELRVSAAIPGGAAPPGAAALTQNHGAAIEQVYVVVLDPDDAERAQRIVSEVIGIRPAIQRGPQDGEESSWMSEW